MITQVYEWLMLPVQKALYTSVILICATVFFLLIDAAIPKFKDWTRVIFLFVVVATVGRDVLSAFTLIEEIASVFSGLFLSLYPLLSTMLLFSNSVLSVMSWHPAILFFVQLMVYISSKWLIPAVGIAIILDFASTLVPNVSFARMAELLRFTVLTIVSACVIGYTFLMTISGIALLSVSQVVSGPLKKVVEQTIPLVGSFVVEGFSLFNQFTTLTTSWLGITAMVTVWTLAFLPTLQLVLSAFTFKYLAALLEPIAYGEISRLLDEVGRSIFVLCGVSFLLAFAFVFTCLFLLVMVKMTVGGAM